MSNNVWYRDDSGELKPGEDLGIFNFNGSDYRKIKIGDKEIYVIAYATGEIRDVPELASKYGWLQNTNDNEELKA